MLVVEQNKTFVNWELGDAVHPLEYAGDVVVVFDPSKTNMAMLIGTPDGTILNTLEFSGNNRGRGPAMDTSLYCEQVQAFLREYLINANLYTVGVEAAILKGERKFYHSTMVLTEIRANLLNFFLHEFHMHVIEVNNWSWKSAILPDGYRSRSEKGSKRWFVETMPNSPYSQYYAADMTDCICIYWYLIRTACNSYSLYCNRVEKSFTGFQYSYVPQNSCVCDELQQVVMNPRFSLEDNIAYYSNRILHTFFMEVDACDINIDSIYGHAMLFKAENLNDKKVKVVAIRK